MDHYITAAAANAKGSVVLIACRCGEVFTPDSEGPLSLRWPPEQFAMHMATWTEEA